MEYIKDIGAWLRTIRKTHYKEGPLNSSEFAEKLNMGWDKTIISKIETGRRSLRADEFLEICEKLGYQILTEKEMWNIKYNANALRLHNKNLESEVEDLKKEIEILNKRINALKSS